MHPLRHPHVRLALALAAAALAGGAVVWIAISRPAAAPAMPSPMAGAGGLPHSTAPAEIDTMLRTLQARLQANPDDAEGWAMLARSQAVSGRHADALPAFREAERRRPADAVLLADYADALAMSQGRRLDGEPEQLIRRALAADPDQPKALSLAATLAFDRGDFAGALRRWQRVAQVAPGSVFARQAEGGIDEARQRLGQAAAPRAAAADPHGGADRLYVFTQAPASR